MFTQPVRVAVILAAVLCAVSVIGAASEVLRVSALTRSGRLLVSFELEGAFTGELRDTIQSGLQTTFTYDVALRQEAAFWPDNTVGTVTLEASVRFDSLTEQYAVVRTLDGRVEDTVILENEPSVRQYLTRFERLPLFSTTALRPNRAYRVRVSVATRPRSGWFVWPWEPAAASGFARFTFLP